MAAAVVNHQSGQHQNLTLYAFPQQPDLSGVVTKFHALRPPSISIKDYLERFVRCVLQSLSSAGERIKRRIFCAAAPATQRTGAVRAVSLKRSICLMLLPVLCVASSPPCLAMPPPLSFRVQDQQVRGLLARVLRPRAYLCGQADRKEPPGAHQLECAPHHYNCRHARRQVL